MCKKITNPDCSEIVQRTEVQFLVGNACGIQQKSMVANPTTLELAYAKIKQHKNIIINELGIVVSEYKGKLNLRF